MGPLDSRTGNETAVMSENILSLLITCIFSEIII